MKIILRIIIILLVAAIIAGGFYVIVNRAGLAGGATGGDFRPAFNTSNGSQPPTGFDGGGERGGQGGSLGEGLAGVLGTLAKLAGIGALVIFLQKGFALLVDKRGKTQKTV